MNNSNTIAADIKRGMTLAFFASAFADMADEGDCPLQGEIMDQLPAEIDTAAIHAADTLAMAIIAEYSFVEPGLNDTQKMAILYINAERLNAADPGDRDLSPELFGHYCAMSAMGHGVGLESFGSQVNEFFKIPYHEFGSYSLSRDYFPCEEENEDE